jgi:hypothetical protein
MISFRVPMFSTLFCFGCSLPAEHVDQKQLSATKSGVESTSAAPKRRFVDARTYLTEPSQIDTWYSVLFALEDQFDGICGDTFCEGDFSNYQSLGLRCSVDSKLGRLGACAWTFAASNVEVEPKTGALQVDARTWHCSMPVVRGTPIAALISALSDTPGGPFYATLPGTNTTLFDGVANCL